MLVMSVAFTEARFRQTIDMLEQRMALKEIYCHTWGELGDHGPQLQPANCVLTAGFSASVVLQQNKQTSDVIHKRNNIIIISVLM